MSVETYMRLGLVDTKCAHQQCTFLGLLVTSLGLPLPGGPLEHRLLQLNKWACLLSQPKGTAKAWTWQQCQRGIGRCWAAIPALTAGGTL